MCHAAALPGPVLAGAGLVAAATLAGAGLARRRPGQWPGGQGPNGLRRAGDGLWAAGAPRVTIINIAVRLVRGLVWLCLGRSRCQRRAAARRAVSGDPCDEAEGKDAR